MATIEEIREDLVKKMSRGVKQVRVTTMEAALANASFPARDAAIEKLKGTLADAHAEIERLKAEAERANAKPGRAKPLGDQLRARAERDPVTYTDPVSGKSVTVQGDLLGTREVALVLGVEKPRIGRWRSMNMMPEPVAVTAAGPVWMRDEIEAHRPVVGARRKGA